MVNIPFHFIINLFVFFLDLLKNLIPMGSYSGVISVMKCNSSVAKTFVVLPPSSFPFLSNAIHAVCICHHFLLTFKQ